MICRKKLRKLAEMAKNAIKKGKSARHGNAPSPYTKYEKTPYKYSAAYYSWRADRLAGRNQTKKVDWKSDDRNTAKQFKMAAE